MLRDLLSKRSSVRSSSHEPRLPRYFASLVPKATTTCDKRRSSLKVTRERRCQACGHGRQRQTEDRPDGYTWTDCTRCGKPGPKPADYRWHGTLITHYVNHGETWQGVSGDDSKQWRR